MKLNDFIFKRLKAIQKRNNFNPLVGKIQIKNQPKKLNDFIIFSEYLNLIKKNNLDIKIPYDPLGLNKKTKICLTNKHYIYFARLEKNTSIWKIGHSIVPYKRGKTLQTGNHESIVIFSTLDGNFELEQAVLNYTSNFDMYGGSEWRKLDIKQIKLIISTIKSEGPDFLYKTKLKI